MQDSPSLEEQLRNLRDRLARLEDLVQHQVRRIYLLPQWFAFILMLMITLTAVLDSLRYNAKIIAYLGLIGRFLTPAMLSTGRDNQVGLFSSWIGSRLDSLQTRAAGLIVMGLVVARLLVYDRELSTLPEAAVRFMLNKRSMTFVVVILSIIKNTRTRSALLF